MIYLIYGSSQELLVEKEIKKIVKSVVEQPDEFSVVFYNYDEKPIQEIIDECLTPSLFMDQKVVVVKNATIFQTSGKKSDEDSLNSLKRFFEAKIDFVTLIFTCEGNVDEKKEATKVLKEYASFIKIKNVEKEEWPQVIMQLVGQYKIEMTDDALQEFIARTSGDLNTITNELRKLKLYGEEVTLDIIKRMVAPKLEDNMFDMLDSVLANDVQKSMKIYNDLMIQNEDPIRLVSALASQFRFLYQVSYLAGLGMTNDQIAAEFKNVKPGRIYYSLKKIGRRKPSALLKIIDELADLDLQMKSGEVDKYRAFELFLIKKR